MKQDFNRHSRCRSNLMAVALIACILVPCPARSEEDRYTRAMRSLSEADALFREGRLADAYQGYLELLREFPTWWLPTLKAGVISRSFNLPAETVAAWVERARGLSPTGGYLPLVEGLLSPGVPRDPFRAEGVDPSSVVDPMAGRIALLRAGRLASQGRIAEAEAEYRAILTRNPGGLLARWRLARLIGETGRTVEAAALLREGGAHSLLPSRWRAEAVVIERREAPERPSER